MILEWIDFLRTPANAVARRWGFTTQSVALKFRARRCRQQWQAHLENSHALILEGVRKTKPRSLAILGSGHLLEIPIQELLQEVPEIYLVDLVHPRSVRALAHRHGSLHLIEKDLTGLLGLLRPKMRAEDLEKIDWTAVPAWELPKVDLAVSANLLSQLPLIISESIPMTSEQYAAFARHVRDQHIQRLLELAPAALLFADFQTHYIDRQGHLLKKETYDVSLRDLRKSQEWLWEISPYGEVSRKYRIDMYVRAYWKF